MKFTKLNLASRLLPLALALSLQSMPSVQAQWGPGGSPNGLGATAGTGAYVGTTGTQTYTYASNWQNGTINHSFNGTTLTGDLKLYLPGTALTTGAGGLNVDYSGDYNLTISNTGSGGAKQLNLAGNVSFNPTSTSARTLNLDRTALNLNGADRTFDIGTGHTIAVSNANIVGSNTVIITGGGILAHNSGSGMAYNLKVDEGEYRFGNFNRFATAGTTITIENLGTVDLQTHYNSASQVLVLNGGILKGTGVGTGSPAVVFLTSGITSTGGGDVSFSGSGIFRLNGNVTYSSGAPNKALVFDSTEVELNGSTRTFTVADGSQAIDVDVSAKVSNGGVTKEGLGVMRLGGANTYTGATTVNAGKLVIGSGSINSTSGITVAAGAHLAYNSSTALTVAPTLSGNGSGNRALLSGTGTINAALTLNDLGDVLSPGNSPGVLTFGTSQSWSAYTYEWELNDWTGTSAGVNFDQIAITGALDLSGSVYELDILSLTSGNISGLVPNFSETNKSWTILTTTGGITGFSAGLWTVDASGFQNPDTGTWSISQVGNNLQLDYAAVAAVPEPSTGALVLAAGAVLAFCRRKRAARA